LRQVKHLINIPNHDPWAMPGHWRDAPGITCRSTSEIQLSSDFLDMRERLALALGTLSTITLEMFPGAAFIL
jgi:hypothetical protein